MHQVEINTSNITSFKQHGFCTLNYIETIDDFNKIEQGGLIGGGSNLLIKTNHSLFKLSKTFSYININNSLVIIGGSTSISFVNRTLIKNEFSGLEFLGGIPATIGGCVRMNASAFGKSIEEIFEYAICYSADKGIHTVYKNEASFDYRDSNFKNKIILEVGLCLKKTHSDDIEKKIRENIQIRLTKAPILRTFGSTFKNPPHMAAGKLIEECGLKGKTVNDAMISQKHANYIINLHKAVVDDVLHLIDIAKNNVYKKFNIELEEEVIIL
ncbi:UDP-N-acetylenolpyruvoylglucosamine reductase [Desulfurella amilsii]|uniref:UDP-N-acetylenolpyruvoylglucosamine reductase n=1 Tax=Desulfurella amilsii TaxID=1562698 RepID=A0A1X4XV77_9BACT|nr:UDP-N-acetylmuramate dehydrogenase [Desulfurella amilsii]OSS41430.1 UDP-N-acetylenolpyruvoylglucosamine reductase [Desulfurella amilsii]